MAPENVRVSGKSSQTYSLGEKATADSTLLPSGVVGALIASHCTANISIMATRDFLLDGDTVVLVLPQGCNKAAEW